MVEEVDSLDHIKALMGSTGGDHNGNAAATGSLSTGGAANTASVGLQQRSFDEPSYQISSNNQAGHLASFGASSRLAQVVDPEFRPPAAVQAEPVTPVRPAAGTGSSLAAHVYSLSSPLFSVPASSSVAPLTFTNIADLAATTSTTSSTSLAGPAAAAAAATNTTTTVATTTTNATTASSVPPGAGQRPAEAPHQPPQMPQDQPQVTMPFGAAARGATTTSFSDIARSAASSSGRGNTLGDTLREYGPPVTLGQAPQQFRTVPPVQSSLNSRPNQPVSIHRTEIRAYNSYQIAQRSSAIMSNQQQPGARPVVFIPSNNNLAQQVNSMAANRNRLERDAPIYSPQPPSPPLDRINSHHPSSPSGHHPMNPPRDRPPVQQQHSTSAGQPQPVASIGNRIPKKQGSAANNDKYDEYNMMDLIEKHKECKQKVSDLYRLRADIERWLNDMARSSQGRNLELDKNFRAKKDEQRRVNEAIDEIKSKQKKIADKLLSKYDHRVVDDKSTADSRIGVAKIPRVKMSTAADRPRLKPPSDDLDETTRNRRKLVFSLKSSSLWCKLCDQHFDNLIDYCDHLHKKDHQKNMRSSDLPWRKTKESIDRVKTYDMLKSICLAVANERGIDKFSLISYDQALNPTLDNKNAKLKELSNKRERGKFTDDDPLFSLKGYENIRPIKGFYCQLCDSTYCDVVAIEQHIKGYEHNYLHAKSVATDCSSEETFRALQIKSHKKLYPNSRDDQEQSSSNDPPPTITSTTTATNAASAISNASKSCGPYIPHYKKPTSHIVDEHDVIASKFTNNPAPLDKERAAKSLEIITKHNLNKPAKRPVNPYASKSVLDSDSDAEAEEVPARTRSPRKRPSGPKAPEIVPIKDTRKPSALTRLKRTSHKDITPRKPRPVPYYVSSDTDTVDNEVEILSEVHLSIGDPDSPFPNLDLAVTGNAHDNMLKDPKLAGNAKVVLNRINLEDYKDQLLDASTLWNRVNHLMAKKEPTRLESIKSNLREKVSTKAAYLDAQGKPVPIDINESGDEDQDRKGTKRKLLYSDSEPEEKPNVAFSMEDVIAGIEHEDLRAQKVEGGDHEGDVACDRSTTNEVDESFHMSLLEDFFCEKPKP